jgi:hypothetical protein
MPGQSLSRAEARYLELLQNAIGSPIEITAVLVLAYMLYLRWRGARAAEVGILAAIGTLAVVDQNTVDLNSLTPPSVLASAALLMLLVIGSWWHRSSWQMGLAALLGIAGSNFALRGTIFTAMGGYLPIHLALLAILSLGLLYHDWLGRQIAQWAAVILGSMSLVVLAGYRFAFPHAPPTIHAVVAGSLALLAGAYWIKNRKFYDLVATATCLTVSLALLGEPFIGGWLTHLLLRGKRWIAWGIAFFLLGFLVSLVKGGQIRTLRRWLMRLHLRTLASTRKT